jgi:membrane fusion protein, multidrug efflux system
MTFTIETEKPDRPKPTDAGWRPRRWWKILLVVFMVTVGLYLFIVRPTMKSKVDKQRSANQTRSVSVAVAQAKKGDLAVYLTGLGTVTPFNTVIVKTRVDGQLMEIRFKEGQTVQKGEVLAVIDPRPFEVQLAQAEGQMARDQAFLKNAVRDIERYRELWQQDSIPQQQLDTQEALVQQYKGIVKADQGQIDSARLLLTYCRITAPLSGRIGLRLVDPGNIVHAADANGLIVITQLQPITVIFPIPEDNLQQVLKRLKKGEQMSVEAYDREQKMKLASGSLLTIDNQVDLNTGTVKFKALFPNSGHELFPNQFVNAKLLIDVRRGVIIVPSAAVQRGPQGPFVYAVKADRTAIVRPVEVGEIQDGDVSIKSGLSEGDLVVTDGAERLRDGAKVDLRGDETGDKPLRKTR